MRDKQAQLQWQRIATLLVMIQLAFFCRINKVSQKEGLRMTTNMNDLLALLLSAFSTMDDEIATEEVADDEIATEEVDDDEVEEDICRICRNPGDSDNPLLYPCACNGSIKFVHEDCLLRWLCHSDTLHCEVCKHPFSVSSVYAENAPTRLPIHEFVAGISMKICRAFHFFLRWSFVLSVWFLAIPFVTFWIWRLAFLRSFDEAQSLFLSHISTIVILGDCLLGFLMSAAINFIFSGPNLLAEFLRHWLEGVPFEEVVEMLGYISFEKRDYDGTLAQSRAMGKPGGGSPTTPAGFR